MMSFYRGSFKRRMSLSNRAHQVSVNRPTTFGVMNGLLVRWEVEGVWRMDYVGDVIVCMSR